MAEEEYKNNSDAAKEIHQVPESTKPQLSGEVAPVKKSGGKKFLELFVKADIKDVGAMIVNDIIVPKIKDIAHDAFDQGLDMIFYGEKKPAKGTTTQERSSIYHQYGSGRAASPVIPASLQKKPTYNFREYDFANRGDAEQVMDMMRDILDQHSRVTIAHYYDLIGKEIIDTDWNWGWDSLRGIHAEQTYGNRWEIKFPPIKCVK